KLSFNSATRNIIRSMRLLLRLLAAWPLGILHTLGVLIGWAGYIGSRGYRERFDAHAALAGLDAAQRRAAVAEAGRMVAELPWLWLRPPTRPLGARLHWDGDALIQQALDQGQGLLLLTPHLGSFEVCAQAIAERWAGQPTLTVLYRPARQDWLGEVQATARQRPGLQAVPVGLAAVRQMLRALRRGEMVGLLPDQVPPLGQGAWAPFFGRPAYTMTLAARLARQAQVRCLLIWAERLPRAAGWRLHVAEPSAPLPAVGADDASQQDAAGAVNAEMERLIRQCPQQYLWGYHRYKQPPRPSAEETA
ncbi:MAG: lysophospholipid acyltransferase family protein, partial [Aquabacterium sp.]